VGAAFERLRAAPTQLQQRPRALPSANPAANALPRPAYVVWCDGWDDDARRFAPAALVDASAVLAELVRARGRGVRVLDVGCGDGAFLAHAHAALALPWPQLLGVAAEDERARAADGAPRVPDGSFAVVNVEAAGALRGLARRFDFIVSWSTAWHLVDPLACVRALAAECAAPRALTLLHGLPLSHVAPEDAGAAGGDGDLALAAALQAELRAAGERLVLIAHGETIQMRWIRRLAVTWLHCAAGSGASPGDEAAAEAAGRVPARGVLPLAYGGGLVAAHDGVRARYAPASWPPPRDAAGGGGGAADAAEALLSTAGVRGVSAEAQVARLRAVYEPWLREPAESREVEIEIEF
jgi:SAM-dependent methyltransferase